MDSRVSSTPFSLLRQDPPRAAGSGGNGGSSFRPPTRSMTLGSDPAPFHMLPEGESRLGRFGAGFLIEMIVLFLLIIIPLLIPDKMSLARKYWSMPIEAPPVTPFKPQPPKPVEKIIPKVEVANKSPSRQLWCRRSRASRPRYLRPRSPSRQLQRETPQLPTLRK